MPQRTIFGPNGIRIVLDSNEIYPSDPGAGTPAMVYLGRHSGTYWCVSDTGELDCGEKELTASQLNWLQSDKVENEVNDFVTEYSK
jgi:hypothetical protein